MSPKRRERVSAAKIQEAVNEVLEKQMSLRLVAAAYKMSKSHLSRLVSKAKESSNNNFEYIPNIGNRRIFSIAQENMLTDYLKTCAKMCYGLSTIQVRKLAFQYASKLDICPEKWQINQIATIDWLKKFLKRNSTLSVRKPENTSLARTTGFNKVCVADFFDNLEECLTKFKFRPNMIWNTDETGCSTVTNTPKIITESGIKRVGQISSTERGTLVTMLAFANAEGGVIPPVFIFPRVHYKTHMLQNGPNGALGLANPSGWITEECFLEALKHFVNNVKPTKKEPALIILDNHRTHITINVILFARQNHLIILTFPPHCSHRLQPLDVTVFGPFKARYRASMNDWMTSHPGQTVTIYNVSEFAKDAYYSAFSLQNITSGFKNTGIYPLNKNIFTENDFLPSAATDRPMPMELETTNVLPENTLTCQNTSDPVEPPNSDTRVIVSSRTETSPTPGTSAIISPEMIRPFPKAPPRKTTQKRRKGATKIITATPEKDRLLAESMADFLKKQKVANESDHVRDCLKSFLSENDQKKKLQAINKNQKRKARKPVGKNIESSSSSNEDVAFGSDFPDEYSDGSLGLQKRKRQSTKNDNDCCVCKQKYNSSEEDWYLCKVCQKWANESCGVKGVFNFYCNLCH